MNTRDRFFSTALAAIATFALAACGGEETETADMEMAPETSAVMVETDRFATLDADGDSYLDADEIAEWVDDEGILTQWDIDRDSELDEDEIAGNAFRLWDADGNGYINEDEWRTGTERWYPRDVEVVAIADWDRDGDSELDRDEFAESFDVSALGETWVVEDFNATTFKTAYFDLYDLNDDGRVDRSEWESGSMFYAIPESS